MEAHWTITSEGQAVPDMLGEFGQEVEYLTSRYFLQNCTSTGLGAVHSMDSVARFRQGNCYLLPRDLILSFSDAGEIPA